MPAAAAIPISLRDGRPKGFRRHFILQDMHSSRRHLHGRRTTDTKSSNQMWGGRFASGPDAIMEEINASIGFDKKLFAQDIRGSIAHATMLAHQGIISARR
jgi:hypothetical protein